MLEGKGDPNVIRAMAAGLGLVAGLLALAWLWPQSPHCTFVGKTGAAYVIGKWSRTNPSECQLMLFRDTTVLFTATTHFYKNFIYQCTRFRFDWHNEQNKPPALRIAGEHTFKDELPEPDHLFHFALRVERLWTQYLTAQLGSELSADRLLVFPCRANDFTELMLGLAHKNDIREIRLSQNQLQFVYNDRVEPLAIRDLGSFQAHRGVLKFQQDDVSWFSRQGKFRLDYQHLGNAQAFLYYLSLAIAAQYK
jgi:hypothetical protein